MLFSPISVFLAIAVYGGLVTAMTTEGFLALESRSALSKFEGPGGVEARGAGDMNVHLRELFDEEDLYEREYFDDAALEFVTRYGDDAQDQKRREPEPIYLDEADAYEARDYYDWLEELDARYYDELEERFDIGMFDADDVNARELEQSEIDAREPRRHFFCGTAILNPRPLSDS
ncbi:hypothetical protein JR316_0002954 [Psilocybe cubensis]|uniref:Uncharacterized protein n=2 Tax=Psilocybe cubensis TaxID=181762 RepID=A0ACB8H6F2_PSICU|nr:hypothetical protein JR316_0002954 [Psilocybe cubensis]KAH9483486.1 hypothetical protein JR316_0002954 [Psilocybe cubensis]